MNRRLTILIRLATPLAVVAGGCAARAPQNYPSVVSSLPADSEDHELEFWHDLASRPVTTHDDAFHGLLLYADGKDDSTTYEQRVQTAKDRRWVHPGFDAAAGAPATRGTIAVAIVRIGDVRGGVMRTVFPNSQRYALRELVFQNLYPPNSSENQTFSGAEFLGIVGRLEDFQRVGQSPANPIEPAASPAAEPIASPPEG